MSLLGAIFDIFQVSLTTSDSITDILICAEFYDTDRKVFFGLVLATIIFGSIINAIAFVMRVSDTHYISCCTTSLIFFLVLPLSPILPAINFFLSQSWCCCCAFDDARTNPSSSGNKPSSQDENQWEKYRHHHDNNNNTNNNMKEAEKTENDNKSENNNNVGAASKQLFSEKVQAQHQTLGALDSAATRRYKSYLVIGTSTIQSLPNVFIQLIAISLTDNITTLQLLSLCLSLTSVISKSFMLCRSFTVAAFFSKMSFISFDLISTAFVLSTLLRTTSTSNNNEAQIGLLGSDFLVSKLAYAYIVIEIVVVGLIIVAFVLWLIYILLLEMDDDEGVGCWTWLVIFLVVFFLASPLIILAPICLKLSWLLFFNYNVKPANSDLHRLTMLHEFLFPDYSNNNSNDNNKIRETTNWKETFSNLLKYGEKVCFVDEEKEKEEENNNNLNSETSSSDEDANNNNSLDATNRAHKIQKQQRNVFRRIRKQALKFKKYQQNRQLQTIGNILTSQEKTDRTRLLRKCQAPLLLPKNVSSSSPFFSTTATTTSSTSTSNSSTTQSSTTEQFYKSDTFLSRARHIALFCHFDSICAILDPAERAQLQDAEGFKHVLSQLRQCCLFPFSRSYLSAHNYYSTGNSDHNFMSNLIEVEPNQIEKNLEFADFISLSSLVGAHNVPSFSFDLSVICTCDNLDKIAMILLIFAFVISALLNLLFPLLHAALYLRKFFVDFFIIQQVTFIAYLFTFVISLMLLPSFYRYQITCVFWNKHLPTFHRSSNYGAVDEVEDDEVEMMQLLSDDESDDENAIRMRNKEKEQKRVLSQQQKRKHQADVVEMLVDSYFTLPLCLVTKYVTSSSSISNTNNSGAEKTFPSSKKENLNEVKQKKFEIIPQECFENFVLPFLDSRLIGLYGCDEQTAKNIFEFEEEENNNNNNNVEEDEKQEEQQQEEVVIDISEPISTTT